MEDPLLVRRLEPLGDLEEERQRLVERDRPARDARREVLALDQLHDEEAEHPLARSKPWSVRDVGMVERGERRAASRSKRASRSRSRATSSGRTLIATSRPSLRVAGAVHLAHASGTRDGRDDLVRPQTRACREGHEVGRLYFCSPERFDTPTG